MNKFNRFSRRTKHKQHQQFKLHIAFFQSMMVVKNKQHQKIMMYYIMPNCHYTTDREKERMMYNSNFSFSEYFRVKHQSDRQRQTYQINFMDYDFCNADIHLRQYCILQWSFTRRTKIPLLSLSPNSFGMKNAFNKERVSGWRMLCIPLRLYLRSRLLS